jgi:hypothetical protein
LTGASNVSARGETSRRCPLCGGRAYPWIGVPFPELEPTVGLASPVDPDDPEAGKKERLIDRCENCGSGVEQGPIDLGDELEAVTAGREGADRVLIAPNRASWQAAIGGDGWAALPDWRGRLLLTPRGLELLLERTGMEPAKPAFPPWGANQRWLWQTVLNGITVHPNFATDVLAGRLRPRNARGPFVFAADLIASVLATPLVALLSLPMEALAALLGRGGRMVAHTRPRA